jgi:hypothetical protein
VALTVLAPALGGSTELWTQAVIILGTGVLFLLFPARRSLGPVMNVLFIAIGAVALIGFLPAHWFPSSEWRTALSNLGVHLPDTQSPQPWLTIEASCLLWLGLAWGYYLFAFEWTPGLREKAWDAFCFAVLGLAATLTFAFAVKKHVPFWPDAPEFGFFPNRNQTSNVLGLAGIIIYANAFQHLQDGRKSGWMWLASLALICWALILNYSRSGIILFFAGALAWHLWWLIAEKEATRTKAIAWGPLAILLALLLLAGGDTLLRFRESPEIFSPGQNGRWLIYRDALHLLQESPILGAGLGNFRSLFSAYRQFYVQASEAIHPESDWLWTAAEMGCLVPLLLLGAICVWFRRCFPFRPGTWRRMRVAAMICGIAFAVHGFFDVSGHRIGALWPALFLASTAIHPEIKFHRSRVIAIVFRLLGVFLIAVGIWWFASIAGAKVLPTTTTLSRSFQEIENASAKEDYQTMMGRASEALKIAPLNWELYFNRGFAEAALYRPRSEVTRDFAAARYLLPFWPDLYLKEGQVWLDVGEPDLAFDVWEEGMRRLADHAPNLYDQIFPLIKSNADLRERWRDLAHSNKNCVMSFLGNAEPTEFAIELQRLLAENPQLHSFTPAELKTLFHIWYERGDKLSLAETLQQHPEWQRIAWRELARVYADYQDYRQAYDTVARFCARPRFPETDSHDSIESLARRFRISGNIENDGLRLALAEANHGEVDDALALLKALSAMPGAPRSLHFLEGDIWARKNEWQKAWQTISQYESGL